MPQPQPRHLQVPGNATTVALAATLAVLPAILPAGEPSSERCGELSSLLVAGPTSVFGGRHSAADETN